MSGFVNTIGGGSQPHENMPPFMALNFIIAVEGVYPSRN
jgi:microcystin-dependent protein